MVEQHSGLGNWYDYGARWYDASIGRWNAVDPASELYYPYSSYGYVLNRPLNAIDPDGQLVIFINGNHYGSGAKDYWKGNEYWRERRLYNFEGDQNYWGSFATRVMDHLNDHNAIFRDGGVGGYAPVDRRTLSAEFRHKRGYRQGKADARKVINSIRDKDGNIIETIKVITHSMGGAYAKGYIKALIEYVDKKDIEGVIIEFEADFAPFQPGKQEAVDGVPLYHFSNEHDNIANNPFLGSPYKPIKGATHVDDDPDENKGHSIYDFLDKIRSLPTGNYKVEDGKIIPVN